MDCNHTSPIDLVSNGIPFGAKSIIEECELQSKIGMD